MLPISPGIVAHRYFTGYGQEHGGLAIEIHNNNEQDIEAIYLDTLPWYLKLYLHTFSIQLNGKTLDNQRGKNMDIHMASLVILNEPDSSNSICSSH